jgi:hypothetical protein
MADAVAGTGDATDVKLDPLKDIDEKKEGFVDRNPGLLFDGPPWHVDKTVVLR